MEKIKNFICLFVVSSGQNGENLGSDEEEIIMLSFLIHRLFNNEIIHQNYIYIIPNNKSKNILNDECKKQTGIKEKEVLSGKNLKDAIELFEKELFDNEINEQNSIILTDGQLHLRMCLIRELTNKYITIPVILRSFLDLRKFFKACYNINTIDCLEDMISYIKIDVKSINKYNVYALDKCIIMSQILKNILTNGFKTLNPEIINDVYEKGICNKSDIIDENTIIRARGLPWQATEYDIFIFFSGLNIYKGGIALCLSNNGRRNGEALIRFVSKEHRDLALKKHKNHIGLRYIEVYKAEANEFMNIVTTDCDKTNSFLSRQVDRNQIIIRMRGLPFSCSAIEVITFFLNEPNSVKILDDEEGILFVKSADGKSTGDAFVIFSNEIDANHALLKHRQRIGSRYIELFRSTSAEVQQVLNKFSEYDDTIVSSCLFNKINETSMNFNTELRDNFNYYVTNNNIYSNCIILKSMPEHVSISDIIIFLGDYCKYVKFQGIHLIYNQTFSCTGEALIQLDSNYNAKMIANAKHKKIFFSKNIKYIVNAYLYSEYDETNTNKFSTDIQENNSVDQGKTLLDSKFISKYPYQFIYYFPQLFIKFYN